MKPNRVALPEWGCVVAVIDDHLYSAPSPISGEGDDPLALVDLVCPHFLASVNAAMGTDFTIHEFDIVSCEGCPLADEHPCALVAT
jgi:hypothetical protein